MLDDFDGPRHFEMMEANLMRVFPERELVILDNTHAMLGNILQYRQPVHRIALSGRWACYLLWD